MSFSERVPKVLMVSLATFVGLGTVAFAAYYVYEHREELPLIKNFFVEEETVKGPTVEELTDESTITPTWTIEIEDGNVVKKNQNGTETILADKEDYNVIEFTYVGTSPDYNYMCFLGQTVAPMIMYVGRTDGTDIVEDGIAENCVWSNDSSMIAYTNHTTDVSPHNVHVYFLETEDSTNFTGDLSTEHIMRVYEDPEWSDDDTTITSLYNSYDDQNDWAQTTGYSIINVLTGEVTDMATPVDTSGWSTYTHDDSGITLRHPAGWTASSDCEPPVDGICGIKVTDGSFIWSLDFDPFVTGGGFGYLFDDIHLTVSSRTLLLIDGYTPYILTNYYDGAALAAERENDTIPADEEPWGWSITFTDPDDYGTLGFGSGAMYDQIENNFWSIMYSYEIEYPNEGAPDYSDLPVRGDADLDEAIPIMNAISESVDLPD